MISLEKWKILTPLQKLLSNVGNLGKIIVATSFEWLPKVQKIAQSGHTGHNEQRLMCTVPNWEQQKIALAFNSWFNWVYVVARLTEQLFHMPEDQGSKSSHWQLFWTFFNLNCL